MYDILNSEWNVRDTPHSWYEKLERGAQKIGVWKPFMLWVEQNLKDITSVLEVGGGSCVVLRQLFADIEFAGFDISEQITNWCNENYTNPKHGYVMGDFEKYDLDQKFDLVFSMSCIDHVHDIDKFLESCVKASKKYIYIIAYRGYYPDLKEHIIKKHRRGFITNDLAICKVEDTLNNLGVSQVKCFSIPVDRPDWTPTDLGILVHV